MSHHRHRATRVLVLASLLLFMGVGATHASEPVAHSSATCSDFSNQAAAQRAANTRDPDGDGVYCESLPCPCAKPGSSTPTKQPARARRPKAAREYAAHVTRVVDGDTVKVSFLGDRQTTVRIIGIDTPETHKPGVAVECGGPQATASMKGLAPVGGRVVLRTDPTQDTRDRYGRLLAYAQRRGHDLGRTQVSRGWAEPYVYARKPFQLYTAYLRSQAKARRLHRGVYSRCGGDFHSGQSDASAARSCGAFRLSGLRTPIRVRVTRGGVGCGRARQVMSSLFHRKRSRVFGWACIGPQTGYAACRKRGNRVEAGF